MWFITSEGSEFPTAHALSATVHRAVSPLPCEPPATVRHQTRTAPVLLLGPLARHTEARPQTIRRRPSPQRLPHLMRPPPASLHRLPQQQMRRRLRAACALRRCANIPPRLTRAAETTEAAATRPARQPRCRRARSRSAAGLRPAAAAAASAATGRAAEALRRALTPRHGDGASLRRCASAPRREAAAAARLGTRAWQRRRRRRRRLQQLRPLETRQQAGSPNQRRRRSLRQPRAPAFGKSGLRVA